MYFGILLWNVLLFDNVKWCLSLWCIIKDSGMSQIVKKKKKLVNVYMLSSPVSNEIWPNTGASGVLIRFTNPMVAFKGGLGVSFKNPPKSFRLPASQIFMTLKATFAVVLLQPLLFVYPPQLQFMIKTNRKQKQDTTFSKCNVPQILTRHQRCVDSTNVLEHAFYLHPISL